MAMSPKDYPIKLTPEQEEAISTMPPMEIPQYLHEIELAAGLRVRDAFNSEVIHLVEQPAAAQPLSQTFTINGETHTFTGANQAEIDAAQVSFFRKLTEDSAAKLTTTNDTLPRDDKGRFARGEQPPKNNVVEPIVNGLVTKALQEELGITPAELQAVVEQKRYESGVQSWTEATETFKKGPGSDWPGGEANKKKLGELLPALEVDGVTLTDMPDKVAALTAAYQYMKDNELFVKNPETELNSKIASASSQSELDEILGISARRNNASLFGRAR
jgi:hypothetical protein